MEWVETTAKSVDEAKELALDKLGVDDSEAEFEVVEEPRQGLFGRTRGQARVRARVQPKAPRAKDDSRDRKRRRGKPAAGTSRSSTEDDSTPAKVRETTEAPVRSNNEDAVGSDEGRRRRPQADRSDAASRPKSQTSRRNKPVDRLKKEDASMEDVQSCVQEFLTGLTSAFGIDANVSLESDEEQIMATIEGKHGLLLGPKARTLDAIQELTRVTAQRSAPSSVRIKVDVGGYREARREALGKFANEAAERALEGGIEVVLEPMNSADRKVVHDALNDVAGVSTRSAGTDPRRFVVVVPDSHQAVGSSEDESADV